VRREYERILAELHAGAQAERLSSIPWSMP